MYDLPWLFFGEFYFNLRRRNVPGDENDADNLWHSYAPVAVHILKESIQKRTFTVSIAYFTLAMTTSHHSIINMKLLSAEVIEYSYTM